jgi:hypothetical protein
MPRQLPSSRGTSFARIGFLASDALQGRDTPSQGLEAAAAYMAAEFHRLGLRPAGTDGYLQRWPFVTAALDRAGVRLEFQAGDTRRALAFGQDYYVAAGSAEPFSGGVVFAGRELPTAEPATAALRDRAVALYMPELSQGAVSRARGALDGAGATALLVLLGPDVTSADIARAAAAAGSGQHASPRASPSSSCTTSPPASSSPTAASTSMH